MSGHQNDGLNARLTELPIDTLRIWYLGWRDYWSARPYPFGYDRWFKSQQINYESGRLNAANVRALGVVPPPWDGTRFGIGIISRLADRADRRLGPAVP